jgi:flagellar transcriptional activator FlhC
MNQTALAIRLIKLGARLLLLETELKDFSRERLLVLYREVKGGSPPKGMLPYANDWFYTWRPAVHSSLFMSYYQFLKVHSKLSPLGLLIRAYELYSEEVSRHRNYDKDNVVFSITRAWIMLRHIQAIPHPLLQMTECINCKGEFVTSVGMTNYVCGFCDRPARAGKTDNARTYYL